MPLLEVRNVAHGYGGRRVLASLSFSLDCASIACLVGPSGCGKTTILRCIAGFERLEDGEVILDGRVLSNRATYVPPEQRRFGMVFQDYALFPHLTVAKNVAFGLHRVDARERDARVAAVLDAVGLAGKERAWPHELSGGQQQRVALARALAPEPRLLLLDEPFSNLDPELREQLAREVREILKARGITAILVTHDQQEAFAMADEIGIMREGRIVQWDTAYNLYHWPANRFVAHFVGEGVLLPGRVLGPHQVGIELGVLDGNVPEECIAGCPCGCRVDVLLRPDDIVHDDMSETTALVVAKTFRGAEFLYTLQLGSGARVLSLVPSHHNHVVGERIGIRVDANHVVAFHEESRRSPH